MIPAHAATQKIRRPATCRSYSGLAARRCRMTNAIPAASGDDREAGDEGSLVRHGREVDPEDQRADEQRPRGCRRGCRPDRSSRSRGRDETDGHDERDDRERQRDQEDRAPPEVLEQQRPRTAARAPRSRPRSPTTARSTSSAAGPDHSAVISARVVGYAMPADSPPPRRATNRTSSLGRVGGEQAKRDRQRGAEDEHQLAAVAVADRAEPQHRGREPERVADGDQVQASSATSRTPPRSTAGRRWRPPGSGWRPPRPGSA